MLNRQNHIVSFMFYTIAVLVSNCQIIEDNVVTESDKSLGQKKRAFLLLYLNTIVHKKIQFKISTQIKGFWHEVVGFSKFWLWINY